MSQFNIGTSALQEIQATPALSIVPKAHVCPSALREPSIRIVSALGHEFDVVEYDNECRVLQSMKSAVSYRLNVVMEQDGNIVTTHSYINGRFVSTQEYIIYPRYAGIGRYLGNAEQAVRGTYVYLESLVLNGKA